MFRNVKVKAFLQLFLNQVAKDLKHTSNEQEKSLGGQNPLDWGTQDHLEELLHECNNRIDVLNFPVPRFIRWKR